MDTLNRDTFVLEFHADQAVGTDQQGEKQVCTYLEDLADQIRLQPLCKPKTHISPKYGLSGWVPLEDQSAIHLYAWDDRHPSFVSVDISSPRAIDIPAIISQAKDHFSVIESDVGYKTLQNQNSNSWKELQPNIWRQRLLMQGALDHPIAPEDIGDFLPNLAEILKMRVLAAPFLQEQTGWMHWETSGCLAYWDDQQATIEIYTCKPFSPEDAIAFMREQLQMSHVIHQNF